MVDNSSHARHHYLVDASIWVHLYYPHPQITPYLRQLVTNRELGKAFIWIPNFCIAETFNTLAKIHYRERKLDNKAYESCLKEFRTHLRSGKIIYGYDLSHYHVVKVDYIIPYEHELNTKFFDKDTKEEKEWAMSTYDLLIICMGMELCRIMGHDLVTVLTCDKRIHKVLSSINKIPKPSRQKKHDIPLSIDFPKCHYFQK